MKNSLAASIDPYFQGCTVPVQVEGLQRVQHLLEAFVAVVSNHNNPQIHLEKVEWTGSIGLGRMNWVDWIGSIGLGRLEKVEWTGSIGLGRLDWVDWIGSIGLGRLDWVELDWVDWIGSNWIESIGLGRIGFRVD